MKIDKAIYDNDICWIEKYINACNRVFLGRFGARAKENAYRLKCQALVKCGLKIIQNIDNEKELYKTCVRENIEPEIESNKQ